MVERRSITLKQLRALSAVVETGSVTLAAKSLFVTPPAVSSQLRALEDNLGAPALVRNSGGVSRPTPIGEAVLTATHRIETALEDCSRRVTALREGREGYVALGVVSTGKYFAPGLVARLRREHPDIEIGLSVGNRGEIVQALARNEIEVAIMGRPPAEPEVEADPLGDHPYIVIAAPTHPLARMREVTPDALFSETFLMREQGSGTRVVMTRVLDRLAEGRPYHSVVMGSNETIKQAVMAGLGIAFISAHTVVAELNSRRLVPLALAGLPFMRTWYMVRRADLPPSPVAAAFRAFVLDLHGNYLPRLDDTGVDDYSELGFEHKMSQT